MRWLLLACGLVVYPLCLSWAHFRNGFVREFQRLLLEERKVEVQIIGGGLFIDTTSRNTVTEKDCDNNETLAADISAAKEFHAQVESAHKNVTSLNRQFDRAKFDHDRLLAQMNAETVLVAHLTQLHRFLICELAKMHESLLESTADCADEEGTPTLPDSSFLIDGRFASLLFQQAQTSALLAVAEEDLQIINTTEISQLRKDCAARGKDVDRIKAQLPDDAKGYRVQFLKTSHAQLDQHPGIDRTGRLNSTAVVLALRLHLGKWWVWSGWERLRLDAVKDWYTTLCAVYARRKKYWATRIAQHRKHTHSVKSIESYVVSKYVKANQTAFAVSGISLDSTARFLASVFDQGLQVATEIAVVIGHAMVQIDDHFDIAGALFRFTVSSLYILYVVTTRLCYAFWLCTERVTPVVSARFWTAASIVRNSRSFPPTAREHSAATLLFILLAPIAFFAHFDPMISAFSRCLFDTFAYIARHLSRTFVQVRRTLVHVCSQLFERSHKFFATSPGWGEFL